jgi:hypothetical protein
VARQVFTAQEVDGGIRIDGPHAVRSVQFEKAAASTRLRITYRDKAVTAPSPDSFTAAVELKLDGSPLPLLRTVFDAVTAGRAGDFEVFRVSTPFTTVGYVSDVPAGTHTLASSYVVEGPNVPIVGFVSGPYLIEIEELP